MVSNKPKWKRFEELVHKIQSELSPDAQVERDCRVKGQDSGAARQVDVCIRQKVGQYEILIALDCKDLAEPIDVKGIEEVIGLMRDIRANQSAVVSASGFTPAALEVGKKAGMNLYRLVDTGAHDWQVAASIPVLMHRIAVPRCSFTIRSSGQLAIPGDDISELEIYSINGEYLGKLPDVFVTQWRDKEQSKEPGVYEDVDFLGGPAEIWHDGESCQVFITANFEVEHSLFFRQLPLEKVSGFTDESDGTVSTKGFTNEAIDLYEIERNWQQLESEDELAITPVMTFWITN